MRPAPLKAARPLGLLAALLVGAALLLPWTVGNLRLLRAIFRAEVPTVSGPHSAYLAGKAAASTGAWPAAAQALAQPAPGREALRRTAYLQALGRTPAWRDALAALDPNAPGDAVAWVQIAFDHRQEIDLAVLTAQPQAAIQYAALLLGAAEYAHAEAVITALPPAQRSRPAQITLGRALFYQGKLSEAEAVFAALHRAAPDAESAFWLGRAYFDQGRQDEGLAELAWAAANAKGIFQTEYLTYLIAALIQAGACPTAQARLEEARGRLYTPTDQATLASLEQRWAAACAPP